MITLQPALAPSPQPRPAPTARALIVRNVGRRGPFWMPIWGPDRTPIDNPYEIQRFQFTSQGEDVFMAYMDVLPRQSNGRTAVLLHGRNFCAATWESSINVLRQGGYRVIAPDQVGFCKSSK